MTKDKDEGANAAGTTTITHKHDGLDEHSHEIPPRFDGGPHHGHLVKVGRPWPLDVMQSWADSKVHFALASDGEEDDE